MLLSLQNLRLVFNIESESLTDRHTHEWSIKSAVKTMGADAGFRKAVATCDPLKASINLKALRIPLHYAELLGMQKLTPQ
jgi:hypothetical protein